jgi:type IV pilus assembly protein PilC
MYRQLARMLHAGIPANQGLQFLEGRVDAPLRPMVRAFIEHTRQGGRFSAVMSRHSTLFPAWEMEVMRAAEASGALVDSLDNLGAALEGEIETRRKLRSHTLLPRATLVVFVLVLMIAVTGFRIAETASFPSVAESLRYALTQFAYVLLAFGGLVCVSVIAAQLWQS